MGANGLFNGVLRGEVGKTACFVVHARLQFVLCVITVRIMPDDTSYCVPLRLCMCTVCPMIPIAERIKSAVLCNSLCINGLRIFCVFSVFAVVPISAPVPDDDMTPGRLSAGHGLGRGRAAGGGGAAPDDDCNARVCSGE